MVSERSETITIELALRSPSHTAFDAILDYDDISAHSKLGLSESITY